ncbi:GNAT family N-acetyltransferase [Bordetella genomosp. 13]|uniref:GNAT family N-acetyltransferase n=1 Tax=Bordetella genomosp. 13 TaxID=463040 RepID=A0A1W6ZIW9_9BORD|nr:GNAT family N-acetyltransferase [Bordetella genomosp. 13]ARP97353.1 GNAT family N-acetyltransferase [Bordetella genomosp. 13]
MHVRTPAMALRPATEADVDFLLALRKATMGPHMRAAGLPDDDAAHMTRLRFHWADAQVILLDGRPAGLFKAFRESDHWYVQQVQVSPAWQGHGVGARVLATLLEQADRDGLPVRLSVLHANPARRLYERLGFRVVATEGPEYVMQRDARVDR